jgi:hypothetical protein
MTWLIMVACALVWLRVWLRAGWAANVSARRGGGALAAPNAAKLKLAHGVQLPAGCKWGTLRISAFMLTS